jgi:hypothetical protein
MIEMAPDPLKLEYRSVRDEGDSEVLVNLESTSVPNVRSAIRVPFFIPREQAYYWTHEWQEGIHRSMADLQAGNYTDFSPDDPGGITRRFLDEAD